MRCVGYLLLLLYFLSIDLIYTRLSVISQRKEGGVEWFTHWVQVAESNSWKVAVTVGALQWAPTILTFSGEEESVSSFGGNPKRSDLRESLLEGCLVDSRPL
jgi:hypothetical protein